VSLRESIQSALGVLLVVLVLVAIAWLPNLNGSDLQTGSRVTDRLDELEAEQKRLKDLLSNIAADVVQLDTRSERSAVRLAEFVPAASYWIELRPGGNAQWDLGSAGRARVEFLKMSEASPSLPTFRVTDRAGQISVELAAGQVMRAVDDQGTSQVAYLTTLHRLRLDRNGFPEAALVSITAER